jgi:hypothetical protein
MYQEDSLNNSYSNFKKYFNKAIFLKDKKIKDYAIKKALENKQDGVFLEFGVYKAKSINYFSQFLGIKIIYGFDSFQGLREDWAGTQALKGTFDLKGMAPKTKSNVVLIKGWIQDTLPDFLNNIKTINFIHMDIDTYESTYFVLKNIKPYLNNGSIIIFDELYNYIGWEENEYRALTEVFSEKEFKYVAFSKDGSEVVIEYIKQI